MKSSTKLLALPLTIAAFLLAGTAAKADSITIVLDAPFQIGQPGASVTFDATPFNLINQHDLPECRTASRRFAADGGRFRLL